MSHIPREKIAILDFSRGEVYIFPISEREEASDFFQRKGFDENNIQWIRGDLKLYLGEVKLCIEDETNY